MEATGNLGAWSSYGELTPETKAVFEKVRVVGNDYVPLCVARQVVAGINYSFICEATELKSGETYNVLFEVYEAPNTEPVLVEISKIVMK